MIKFVAYVGEQFQNKICCEICKEYEIEKTTYIFVSVWRMIPQKQKLSDWLDIYQNLNKNSDKFAYVLIPGENSM